MKSSELKTNINQVIGKIGFNLKKNSPEIFIIAGGIGVIVGTVMACKATLKVNDILDEAKENIDTIHTVANDEEKTEEYTEEDAKKDLAIVYAQTGLKIAKLYAPAVIIEGAGLVCMFKSNDILKKRNLALGAAYAAVDKGFKEYRSRVVDKFGEEVDNELRNDIKAKKIEEIETDPETGKSKKVKKNIETTGIDGCSEYARFFDESCAMFEKDRDYSMMVLRAQQNYANDKLKARGYIYLNEVYDLLGIPQTKAGQVVGWVYDPKDPIGDNYVDFGIREVFRDTADGKCEETILLDFNVDGVILDLM